MRASGVHGLARPFFWGLKPYGQFFDLIGRSPGAVSVEQLRAAATGFRKSDARRARGQRPAAVVLSEDEDSESSLGQVVVLTPDTHADFFTALRTKGQADFTLEPATFASSAPRSPFDATTAAWSGKVRPDIDKDAPNPFCTMANVRLTKVRVWLLSDPAARGNHTAAGHPSRARAVPQAQRRAVPAADRPSSRGRPGSSTSPSSSSTSPIEIPFAYDASGDATRPRQVAAGVHARPDREDTQATVDGDLDFPGIAT